MTKFATFGAGCFWCTEAVFKRLRGVTGVEPGYAGGTVKRPTYPQVCSGSTGHAEVIRVEFDPAAISYEQLVEVFFGTHDPTQLNRQDQDVGTQYRSVIFFHDPEQRQTAENVKQKLERDKVFTRPIMTAIEPLRNYFPAENYHRDYYERNAGQPYCRVVISPKLAKLREKYADRLV